MARLVKRWIFEKDLTADSRVTLARLLLLTRGFSSVSVGLTIVIAIRKPCIA